MQITIDVKNKQCPAPLILTKQAIMQNAPDIEITIISNDTISKDNVITYLKELGINAKCLQEKGDFKISFTNPPKIDTRVKAEEYCNTNKVRTIVIKSELMGDGDTALGAMLMRGFINAIPEADTQPNNIILYNSGIKTALQNSDTAETYKKLEAKDVKIVVCGTCIDYYNLKEQLGVGTIGNMYKITEILLASDTIIYP